jgi:hypothetical protein
MICRSDGSSVFQINPAWEVTNWAQLSNKSMEKKSITRELRCSLSEKEIIEAARASADLTRAIGVLEDDKARSNKDYAARIAEKEAGRSVLNEAISSGFVLRNVTCESQLSTPKPGFKRIVRLDTNEEVAVEAMTPDELQRELELDGGFVFSECGICVKPACIILKCPLGGAVVAIAKAPGDGASWFWGYRLDEALGVPARPVEMGKDSCPTAVDAAFAGLSDVSDCFAALPADKYGKKSKAAVDWIKLHADAVKTKISAGVVAGKEIVVE